MSTNFPTGLDTFVNPRANDQTTNPSHADQHANANDAIAALEAKVGINGSAVTSSLDYILRHLTASQITDFASAVQALANVLSVFGRTGAVTAQSGDYAVGQVTNAVATSDSRLSDSRAPTGTAGGDLTGTYPDPSLKLTGTAGTYGQVVTDAQGRVTSGDTCDVAHGGTGDTSLTAYAVLCGGTTSTGAVQSVASLGTAGWVLTSNGAGALPTFQAASGAVTSVSNSDSTLIINPTTGAIVASLNLGHANTWTATQTFNSAAAIFGVGTITPKIYPAADSTGAVKVLKANGTTSLLTVDTTNGRIGVNLDAASGPGVPGFLFSLYTAASVSDRIWFQNGSSDQTMSLILYGATGSGQFWSGIDSANAAALTYTGKVIVDANGGLIIGNNGQPGITPLKVQVATSQTVTAVQIDGISSTATSRPQADVDTAWVDATDATRSADLILRVWYTTTAREGLRIRGGSSDVQLGFYGVTPISRAVLATGAGHTVDDIITALQNLGLVKQS